jgi:hypothetical protein
MISEFFQQTRTGEHQRVRRRRIVKNVLALRNVIGIH